MAFSRRHYRLVSPSVDMAADVSARLIRQRALELARADVEAKYATVSATNAAEILAWQEERIQHHTAAMMANNGTRARS